jgi:CHAD domain-containing protein
VRELDVLRIRLAGLAARAKPERKLAIEMVDSRLSRLRRRARARMMKRFAAVDLDRLDLQLRRLTGAPPEPVSVDGLPLEAGPHVALMAPLDAPATIPIDELLERAAPEMAGAAKALVDADIPGVVGSSEAMEALHRVRIQAKKLRYGLEIVAVDRGASGSARVEELRELQDALGDLHDDTVLDAVLRDAMARQVERGRPLLARELRRLRSARRRALNRAERACRAALTALRERGFADAVAEVFRADSLPPSSASATVANASEEAEPGEPGTDASGSLHLAGR